MASTVEAIAANIEAATEAGFRGRLLARGQARAMMWREGVLPVGPPPFSPLLSYDLLSYGYSLLSHGLRLLELDGDRGLARTAFEHAASAIEAVLTNGRAGAARDFHTLVAAAAYHLGRYSARAYSLLHASAEAANLSTPEQCLAHLMLRNLDQLQDLVAGKKAEGHARDAALVERLRGATALQASTDPETDDIGDQDPALEVLVLALDDAYLSALATALLAFERGERALLDSALDQLRVGLEGAGEFNLVPQWWCHRLSIHLLDELWDCSFHTRLAPKSPDPQARDWPQMRELFIASLFRRARAEIDLWPSQIEAAKRALEVKDNLVVSLPTSAGKTRIAELCILACLAAGKRVVFVTPLRALSAQTEISLQKTFQPLGKSVSSLYGAIGGGGSDDNLLRERDIIVSTPEKLDFALRSDPIWRRNGTVSARWPSIITDSIPGSCR
ncbi:DEAD/DEAH box helicase [Caulobacter sp. LjRoot300]|uniref:DEAD/DEAH box helicase n=1 Tax=Caulobacter sp. LjRoot300 TaxID=3342321 RepID=UPI003ECE8541